MSTEWKREAFEQWARSKGFLDFERDYETYHDEQLQQRWLGWMGAMLSAAPDAPGGAVPFVPTHRHKKRGSVYRLVGEAEAQVAAGLSYTKDDGTEGIYREIEDGARLTVYQGEYGALWVRFTDEFEDGRFEKLTPVAVPAPVKCEYCGGAGKIEVAVDGEVTCPECGYQKTPPAAPDAPGEPAPAPVPAQAVKVKPLVWERDFYPGLHYADTLVGTYRAYADGTLTLDGATLSFVPGREWHEMEVAAQADHERRILSALEPTPSLSTRGEAPARTYADGLEDALSAVAALHDPDDDGWKDALDAAITAIRSLKEGK